ncbi:ATP-grasp domain-containing protein [Guptibacillus hwajinpoensis]|uniref:ATP-grasp domain-containing protein n=1 Tax=Guptibacillus hwajinpoensis TaxID=208199 RepID=UPI0024B35A43|nr:ATP-grasp domain-containing protein [Pseudalkalibacillus hwajinpoensis]
MENIMILGANTLQLPLIQQAKKSGYNTVVVSPNKNEPGFEYATYSVFVDIRNEEAVLRYAQKYSVVGVVTDQTDIPVRTSAFVSEHMGLPGIGYETACLFTDKYLMREKCKDLGIPTLRYKKVENLKEAEIFFEDLNREVILKPIDNQGSKGISKVTKKEELQSKFEEAYRYSKAKTVLIEEYISGDEFVVEGIAYNYEYQNLISGDTYYFDIPNVFSATKRIFPSKKNANLIQKVEDLNTKIIKGFGLKQGITHSEFILRGEDVYLIETAARGGGVFISSDLIPLSTGLNTEKFLVGISTGKINELPEINKNESVCGYAAFFLPVGDVASIEGIEEVRAMQYTHRDNLDFMAVGMKTKPFNDKTARGFIIVSAENQDQFENRLMEIRNTLKVVVETDEGYKGLIWN